MTEMRSVELFAGAGGLGMGVCRAGFTPLAVIERDNYCCDTIRENQRRDLFPLNDWPLVQGDIRDFKYSRIRGTVDFVSGGPPCQPFSLGGKHRGRDDARDMFPQAVRALRELKPRAFLFENVKGLTRTTFATYFEYIRLQMTYPELVVKRDQRWQDHLALLERHHTHGSHDGLSYKIVARVLNAANYGIPQRRERIFFVGFRADTGVEWAFPDMTHSREALIWDQTRGGYWERHRVPRKQRVIPAMTETQQSLFARTPSQPWRTVRDVLSGLPDPEREPEASSAYLNHRFQAGARTYKGHTGSPLDEPAKTLKAGVHGVPGGENMLCRPDGSVRYFTVREAARLQTFPDDFLFHGSWTETMRQLGNAVPVSIAHLIASDIRQHLVEASPRPRQ
jgi:DNA (cytosine-5)-methyltransferase 1